MLRHHGPDHNASGAEPLLSLPDVSAAPQLEDGGQRAGGHESVEDYLDHIMAPLVPAIDYRARVEIRRDMRAHLDQLIAAHQELGSDPEEATIAAIRQFGPASVVARKWLDESAGHRSGAHCYEAPGARVGPACRWASRRLAAGTGLWVGGVLLLEHFTVPERVGFVYLAIGAALPAAVGYLAGRRFAAGRAALGMLLAQAMVLPVWPLLLMYLLRICFHSTEDLPGAAIMGATSFAALAPTGCLGAWLGARTGRCRRARKPMVAR